MLTPKSEYVRAAVIGDDKLIRITNSLVSAGSTSLTKKVVLGENPKDLTVAYYAKLSKSGVGLILKDANETTFFDSSKQLIDANTVGAKMDGWNLIKAQVNFEKKTATLSVNGKVAIMDMAFSKTPKNITEVFAGLYAGIKGADTMLWDNVIMYTSKVPELGNVKYHGTTGTNWAAVGNDVPQGGYIENLRAHPRLIIGDRQAILDKIVNDDQCAIWYKTVKTWADLI